MASRSTGKRASGADLVNDDVASQRTTARGTVKLAVQSMVALAGGLAIHVYLARALKPEAYGLLAVVTSIIVWWESAGVPLLTQATVRFVAWADEEWRAVARSAVRTTILWGCVLALVCAMTARCAAVALGDASLTPYIVLFSLDLLFFPLYRVTMSVLAGRRHFGHQAVSGVCYWIAKAGLTCVLVSLGWSIRGAIVASICASIAGLGVAWYRSGLDLSRGAFAAPRLVAFGPS